MKSILLVLPLVVLFAGCSTITPADKEAVVRLTELSRDIG